MIWFHFKHRHPTRLRLLRVQWSYATCSTGSIVVEYDRGHPDDEEQMMVLGPEDLSQLVYDRLALFANTDFGKPFLSMDERVERLHNRGYEIITKVDKLVFDDIDHVSHAVPVRVRYILRNRETGTEITCVSYKRAVILGEQRII